MTSSNPIAPAKWSTQAVTRPFELGFGRSKAEVDARGEGPVYLEHLLKIYRTLQRRGYRMQFWGDVLIRHPDLVRELPRDIIALEWGYEANHPFEGTRG